MDAELSLNEDQAAVDKDKDQDKDTEEQIPVDPEIGDTEEANPPPSKRVCVSVGTTTQEDTESTVTVDLTQENNTRSQAPAIIDRAAVSQALGFIMEAESAQTGELLNNFLVAGSTLDDRIRVKIVTGQYVDLASLLPKSDQQTGFVQISESGHHLQFNPGRPRAPTSFMEWLKLFCIYASTYTEAHPEYAPAMFSYIMRILSLYRNNQGSYLWRQYDEMFRRMRVINTTLPWQIINNSILREAETVIRESSRANFRPQYQPNATATQSTPSTSASNGKPKVCFDYNDATKVCKRKNCKFLHQCSKCMGNHPASNCKQSARATSQQQQPKPSTK